MDVKQNPFSVYDFLGYLTPGAIFLYGVIAVTAHISPEREPVEYIITIFSFKNRPEIYIPFILIAYTTGHVLSFLSSIIIERFSVWKHGYPSQYLLDLRVSGFFDIDDKTLIIRRRTLRCLTSVFLIPILFLDLVLGKYLGFRDLYVKKLDSLLIEVLKGKLFVLLELYSGKSSEVNYERFLNEDSVRYCSHFALEYAPNHRIKMHNYVALYGFLRTLTLISVVLFWWIVWHSCIGTFSIELSLCFITITSLVSYVLYMAFMKFYRRFSLEVMMAVAVTVEKK